MQYMEKTLLSSNCEFLKSNTRPLPVCLFLFALVESSIYLKMIHNLDLHQDQEIQFPPVLQLTDSPFPYK